MIHEHVHVLMLKCLSRRNDHDIYDSVVREPIPQYCGNYFYFFNHLRNLERTERKDSLHLNRFRSQSRFRNGTRL